MSWRSGCPLVPHSGSHMGQCSPFHIGRPRDALPTLVLAVFEISRTILTSRPGTSNIGGRNITLFITIHLVGAESSKVKAIAGFNRLRPISSPGHVEDYPETFHYRQDLMTNDLSGDDIPTVYKHLGSVVGR